MSENSRMSEALYLGLCHKIGTPKEVTIRREVMDMDERLKEPVDMQKGDKKMKSGSFREGFRFESSDIDTMHWCINHKLITDISQSSLYDRSKQSIILVEDSDTPPGFVRLQFLTSKQDEHIESCIIPFDNLMYISTAKWRQIMLAWISGYVLLKNIKSHGPCANSFLGNVETDLAPCFHCSTFSRLTCHWKRRCIQFNWPPYHVFNDILKHGCHFVAVGSKLLDDENELEWRISFSRAEQKLVYSMNHTQFLCYGLLKIFMKEVINRDREDAFLCSYFMKTTLFWLIQIGHVTWYPTNLLDCFWKCFKLLLNFVNRGVLPNFFIPQNNMFANKLATMEGTRARYSLLEQLIGYYENGVSCLLQSTTLRTIIESTCNRYVRSELVVGYEKSAAEIDSCIKRETWSFSYCLKDIEKCYSYLKAILRFSQLFLTEYQTIALQRCTANGLIDVAFLLPTISPVCANRKAYKSDRLICNMLKLAGRLGVVSDYLYLALHYYRTGRFKKALWVTALVTSKLAQPNLLYTTVDNEQYNEFVAGWSLSRRMMNIWAETIVLHNSVNYIEELKLERNVSGANGRDALFIPPRVLADMLCVLCHYKLRDFSQGVRSLMHLIVLQAEDDRIHVHVPLCFRDISLQILGICQEIVGDLTLALKCYEVSQLQDPFNQIQRASQYRILLIKFQFGLNRLTQNLISQLV